MNIDKTCPENCHRFLRLLLIPSLSLMLGACTTTPDAYRAYETGRFNVMPAQYRIMNTVRIQWVIRQDVTRFCAGAYQMANSQAFLTPPVACAMWDILQSECTVFTGPLTTHATVGHEIRHCFEGNFHR